GGVLSVVSEDEQTSPLGVLQHVLREHVDIRHRHSPNRSRGLPVKAHALAAERPASHARREVPRRCFLLPHHEEPDESALAPATVAARLLSRVQRTAHATEKNRSAPPAWRSLAILTVIVCPCFVLVTRD